MDSIAIHYSYLIPLLPLLGAVIAGFFCTGGRKTLAHWPIWVGVLISAGLSFELLGSLLNHTESDYYVQHWFTWISAGNFVVPAGFLFDPLTAVMLCIICGIGFLITVFSAGYMKGEAGYSRFFAYLGLFIFMMTVLVMSENLVMLYLGWEGVGLSSYLLIGYYYERPAAREAAKKAFLVNRVGDFSFALGIMLCFLAFGTVSYFGVGGAHNGLLELAADPGSPGHWALRYIPFLLMVGAFGKSAQFPLYVWLPDAMEGPTPVSALIHAATMVTAGVFMIARCGALFAGNQAALITVAVVGGFTALFAATIAMRQFDLKKVFAYSTVSQLGYMFAAVGVLAPVAGVFHLLTHAFFKALLFLGSGVVMHALAGELDMRKMSGLRTLLPTTRWLMFIGCAALAGVPFLSGFYSKDEIVAAAWQHSPLLALVLLFTAFLTAYYTFRLYFRVFEGPTTIPPPPDPHGSDVDANLAAHGHDDHGHGPDAHHNHEPLVMLLPLILLAFGAIVAGYSDWPREKLADFLGRSPSLVLTQQVAVQTFGVEQINPEPLGAPDHRDAETIQTERREHFFFMIISGALALAGLGLAYVLHLKDRAAADRLATRFSGIVRLLDGRYWIDEIYQAVIVEPLRTFGRLLNIVDRWLIDLAVNMFSVAPQFAGFVLRVTSERGYLQGYAAAMVFGIAAILLIMFL